jgi:hypothetical protein
MGKAHGAKNPYHNSPSFTLSNSSFASPIRTKKTHNLDHTVSEHFRSDLSFGRASAVRYN